MCVVKKLELLRVPLDIFIWQLGFLGISGAQFKIKPHAPVHKNGLENQMFVLGCKLRSHARNENECQTPWHCRSATNIEIHAFNILVNRKLVWNSWNLTWYHGMVATCCGKNIISFGAGVGTSFSQTRASLTTSLMVSVGYVPPWGTKRYMLPLLTFKMFSLSTENNTSVVSIFGILGVRYDIFMH